ncbi:transposase family protein [Streptomyces afghaniensis]|uniref:transposase family protein n=1 Tax=Streptomyces afghaniensis TaxID=66865 RepID=UPI00339E673C
MLVCPSALDLSARHLRFLTDRLTAHRTARGTRWRRLSAGRQALLVLAHLRLGHTYAQLAAGFEVGVSTVYRYITEAVGLLAVRAPDLATAVTAASAKAFVIMDGTLLPIDRIAADRPFYSGKHKRHGMNVQVIADPQGKLLWASPALPGAVHDIKASRTHGIIDALVPFRGRWDRLSTGQRAVNAAHARIRALGEQAMATLKTWRLLRKLRCSTTRITSHVQAVLTLHLTCSN